MNILDLFCGAGGLSSGFSNAGFNIIAGVDHNFHAIKTFQQNHPNAIAVATAIQNIDEDWLSQLNQPIHLICGGPPCQGFSSLGKNQVDDHRNQLPLEFLRIVKIVQPEWVVIENVAGLISKRQQSNLRLITDELETLHYDYEIKLWELWKHNVPQKRRRVFIVANRVGKPFPQLREQSSTPTFRDAWQQYGSSENHDLTTAQIPNPIEQQRLLHIPPGRSVRYEKDELELLPKSLWFNVDWSKLPEARFREAKLHRLNWDAPAPTINTNRRSYYHPDDCRYLTIREAAAIQTFPATFKFPPQPIGEQWKQIGNAVPPEFARQLGLRLNHIAVT